MFHSHASGDRARRPVRDPYTRCLIRIPTPGARLAPTRQVDVSRFRALARRLIAGLIRKSRINPAGHRYRFLVYTAPAHAEYIVRHARVNGHPALIYPARKKSAWKQGLDAR
jgi:hypothetical protein